MYNNHDGSLNYTSYIDVTVSVPNSLTIGEDDGIAHVCSTLSTFEDTERDVVVTLATSDGTGRCYIVLIYYYIDTGKYHESDGQVLHECRRHECNTGQSDE